MLEKSKFMLRSLLTVYLQNPTRMARSERIMIAAWLRSQKKLALLFCGFFYLQNPTRRERIKVVAWLRSQRACLAFLWLLLPAEPHQDGKERKNHDGGMAQVSKS
jgi:hypothetical protein